MVPHQNKRDLSGLKKVKREYLRQIIRQENVKNALIFCNRKRDVDIVNKSLEVHGFNSATLHGDMSQPARTETMERFKAKKITLLVCSDVAARGLDIDDLSHVFNFDVPMHAEDYVHRIGRTGRAGKTGRSVTLAWHEDAKYLDAIYKITGKEIPLLDLSAEQQIEKKRRARKHTDQRIQTPVYGSGDRKSRNKNLSDSSHPDNTDSEETEIGMGNHVPAFLTRSVKL